MIDPSRPRDEALHHLAQLAAQLTHCPIALILLLDRDRVGCKAAVGFEPPGEAPGALAFFAHAVGHAGVFELAELGFDERFRDNPLVAGDPGVRFCAGVRLVIDDRPAGALCVFDRAPRALDPAQRSALAGLAAPVGRLLGDAARARRFDAIERRFGDFLKASSDWIWESRGLRVSWVSDNVRSVLGTEPDRYVGHAITDGLSAPVPPGQDGGGPTRAALLAIRRHEAFRDLVVTRQSSAGPRLIRKSGVPVFGRGGVFRGYRGVARDVTALESARRRADAADARLRDAIEALDETVVLTDAQDRIVLTNRRWREVGLADPQGDVPRTYEDYLRALVGAGRIVEAQGREAQWIAERLAQRGRSAVPFQARIAGRDFLGRDTLLSDGSCLTVALDITEMRASHDESEASARRLQLAMDIAGVWSWEANLDDDRVLSERGPYASGRPSPSMRFSQRLEQLASVDRKRVEARYRALWNGEIDRLDEEVVVEEDGRLRTLVIRAVVQPAHDGFPRRLLGVARDVTAQRQVEEAARLKEAAELANRTKSEFLSRVGHELRTPLNSIKGLAQVLQREEGAREAPAQGGLLAHIVSASDHLGVLLDDLLDMAQVDSGRLSLHLESVPVARALRDSLRMVAPQAAARGVALELAAVPTQAFVRADETRLRQIVLNLLTNAIKYNRPQGRVRLEVIEDRVPGFVSVLVIDTGPGLTPEQAKRIFLPFERIVQLEGEHAHEVEGLGLGLAIAQGLARAMGGEIDVETTLGAGSTFAVHLPAGTPEAPVRSDAQPGDGAGADRGAVRAVPWGGVSAADACEAHAGCEADAVGTPSAPPPACGPIPALPAHPRRVLYVEDNRLNAVLMQQIAQQVPGLELSLADSGEEALARAREFAPDLVLMDNDLPGASGVETFLAMRRDPALAATPVVLVSADASAENAARVGDLGLSGFWIKPLDVEKVIAALGGVGSAAAVIAA